jgi:hypothetical protein
MKFEFILRHQAEHYIIDMYANKVVYHQKFGPKKGPKKSWYEGVLIIKNGLTKIRRYFSFTTRSVENIELYSFNIEEIFNNQDTSSLEKFCKEIWDLRKNENEAFPHLTFD